MKFSALNVDINSASFDSLGTRSPLYTSVQICVPQLCFCRPI